MQAREEHLESGIPFKGFRALDVHIKEEVFVSVQAIEDILALRAVVPAVDTGMLDKGLGIKLAEEFLWGEKVVVLAIHFPLARGPGGGGDDPLELIGKGLKEAVAKGRFTGARRAADNEKKRWRHHLVIQVFEDFPRARAVLWTDIAFGFKNFHNAGSAVVTDF